MVSPNVVRALDPQALRRITYRVAGNAIALAAMHVPIRGISIEALENPDEALREGEIFFEGYNGRREQVAFAYIVGEWAADHSGAPKECEVPNPEPPDLSPIEDLHEKVLEFAEQAIGPIAGVAEALLASKRLSGQQFNQIIMAELKKRKA